MTWKKNWLDWVGVAAGRRAIVAGLGSSWEVALGDHGCDTFGVNDIGRCFSPDYTVVVDEPHRFDPERRRHIISTRSRALFTAHSYIGGEPEVIIPLRSARGAWLGSPSQICVSQSSVFVACAIAYWMGYSEVYVCGSDFDGHKLRNSWPMMREHYRDLCGLMLARGSALMSAVPSSPLNEVLPFRDPNKRQ